MAPFMWVAWEGKSSWAGVGSTKPGRVFVYWVDFTSNGGKWTNGVRSGFPKVTLENRFAFSNVTATRSSLISDWTKR